MEIVNMVAKIKLSNLDDLVIRYQSGEAISDLANDWGVSPQTIDRNLRALGVHVSRIGHQAKTIPDMESFVERYLSGESINALADEAGVGRYAFASNLRKHGVAVRGQSEAEAAKWERMTPSQRRRQVRAAHEATKGRSIPLKSKVRRAKTLERTLVHSTPEELWFADVLRDKGLLITPQKAVREYNVDIATHVPPVAVEIFGGNWHRLRDAETFNERCIKLFNLGWHVLIIWTNKARYPMNTVAADYVAAFCQFAGSEPASRREYRVILGNGEAAPTSKTYLNDRATVEGFGGRFDSSGSHYFITG
jgi:very-short-patch-repair endonuclease